MSTFGREEILRLMVPERIRLIGEIWDSIAESQELQPLSQAQQLELDRRLADHQANPDASESWAVVRDRLTNRG